LHEEARPRREFVDISNVFVNTIVKAPSLATPQDMLPLPTILFLVGTIELIVEDSFLASARY